MALVDISDACPGPSAVEEALAADFHTSIVVTTSGAPSHGVIMEEFFKFEGVRVKVTLTESELLWTPIGTAQHCYGLCRVSAGRGAGRVRGLQGGCNLWARSNLWCGFGATGAPNPRRARDPLRHAAGYPHAGGGSGSVHLSWRPAMSHWRAASCPAEQSLAFWFSGSCAGGHAKRAHVHARQSQCAPWRAAYPATLLAASLIPAIHGLASWLHCCAACRTRPSLCTACREGRWGGLPAAGRGHSPVHTDAHAGPLPPPLPRAVALNDILGAAMQEGLTRWRDALLHTVGGRWAAPAAASRYAHLCCPGERGVSLHLGTPALPKPHTHAVTGS